MDKGSYSVTIMQGNVTSVHKMSGLERPLVRGTISEETEQVPTSCENILMQREGLGVSLSTPVGKRGN